MNHFFVVERSKKLAIFIFWKNPQFAIKSFFVNVHILWDKRNVFFWIQHAKLSLETSICECPNIMWSESLCILCRRLKKLLEHLKKASTLVCFNILPTFLLHFTRRRVRKKVKYPFSFILLRCWEPSFFFEQRH